jgi:septal ring factor EnvC (AmiA/AmiB activator)
VTLGLFDGVIQQGQAMIDAEMTTGPASQLFNQLKAELESLRGTVAAGAATDAVLSQHVTALDQHLVALDAQAKAQTAVMQSLVQHLTALNAHPALAAKP